MEIINKHCTFIFKLLSILFLCAIGISIIIDLVINRQITWSGYVMSCVFFAWAITLPLLMAKKNKILLSLGTLTIAIFPFLFLLEQFTPVKNWAVNLGFPIAVITLIAVWITYSAFRFLKINKWYLSALVVFLFGVVVSSSVKYLTYKFLGNSMVSIDGIINIVSCLTITVSFIIIGKSKKPSQEDS